MKISLAGFSFSNLIHMEKVDIFQYLETIKHRFHLNTADLWNGFFSEPQGRLRKLPDESYLRKVKKVIDESEMTTVNFAIDGAHVWDPDQELREHLYKNALEHLNAAKILGAKTVRIDTGGYESSAMSEEQFDYTVKRFQEYCDIAKDYGFIIGPENHMGPSLIPSTMKKLAEEINRPNYGVLLHVNRWNCKNQDEGNALLAPWAFHVHFDPKRTQLDNAYKEIKTLKDAGYNGYWGIEYNPEKNQYEKLEWAIGSLKKSLYQAEKNRNVGE